MSLMRCDVEFECCPKTQRNFCDRAAVLGHRLLRVHQSVGAAACPITEVWLSSSYKMYVYIYALLTVFGIMILSIFGSVHPHLVQFNDVHRNETEMAIDTDRNAVDYAKMHATRNSIALMSHDANFMCIFPAPIKLPRACFTQLIQTPSNEQTRKASTSASMNK